MAFRRRNKSYPFFSQEFLIQNHADIVFSLVIFILIGLMFEVRWTQILFSSLVSLSCFKMASLLHIQRCNLVRSGNFFGRYFLLQVKTFCLFDWIWAFYQWDQFRGYGGCSFFLFFFFTSFVNNESCSVRSQSSNEWFKTEPESYNWQRQSKNCNFTRLLRR